MLRKIKVYFLNLLNKYNNFFYIQTDRGKFIINTNNGHPLKYHLRDYPKYDRFLPYLSLVNNKTIIDIGSNIGDTVVLIKSINDVDIICVEPDNSFINLFHKNISNNNLKNVRLYPFPLSSEKKEVIIEMNETQSTGNIKLTSSGGIITKSFEELVMELQIQISEIGIIKVDTDGYDWDCLNTIYEFLKKEKINTIPDFIYYEHQTTLNNKGKYDEDRIKREELYINSLKKLRRLNYDQYFIFDNFGSLILITSDLDQLSQIIFYIRNSELENHYTPFYFCDVLITREDMNDVVKDVIKNRDNSNIDII